MVRSAFASNLERNYVDIVSQEDETLDLDLDIFRGVPFWIPDRLKHAHAFNDNKLKDKPGLSRCCFWHAVGLPEKHGQPVPLQPYQWRVYDALMKKEGSIRDKHAWVKKATGLGFSEFGLYFAGWIATSSDDHQNSFLPITTGPNIELATTLIDRLKVIFRNHTTFKNKGVTANINKVRVQAFPSHHLSAARGLPRVCMFLPDEYDFYPPQSQDELIDVTERYITKSDPYLLPVSTPNQPGGLLEQIEKQDEKTCIYHRFHMDFSEGLPRLKPVNAFNFTSWTQAIDSLYLEQVKNGKKWDWQQVDAALKLDPAERTIYTIQEAVKGRASKSWGREFCLKYGSGLGNVIKAEELEDASAYDYPRTAHARSTKSLGIDPAFGSSKFAFVVTQLKDGKIQVLEAVALERPDFETALKMAWSLITKHDVGHVYIDGANPAFVKAVGAYFGETQDYIEIDEEELAARKVQPVNFATDGKSMLGFLQRVFSERLILVHKEFEELITDLRAANEKDGKLDKSDTKHTFDLFDALRLSLRAFYYD